MPGDRLGTVGGAVVGDGERHIDPQIAGEFEHALDGRHQHPLFVQHREGDVDSGNLGLVHRSSGSEPTLRRGYGRLVSGPAV
jgi:hypothetical protein